MRCLQCGAECSEGAAFCMNCGKAVVWTESKAPEQERGTTAEQERFNSAKASMDELFAEFPDTTPADETATGAYTMGGEPRPDGEAAAYDPRKMEPMQGYQGEATPPHPTEPSGPAHQTEQAPFVYPAEPRTTAYRGEQSYHPQPLRPTYQTPPDARVYAAMGAQPPEGDTPFQEGGTKASLHVQNVARPLSTKQYFLLEIIYFLPIINIIVLCALALSGRGNPNRIRLAQAKLAAILVLLAVVMVAAAVIMLLLAADVIDGLYLGRWSY